MPSFHAHRAFRVGTGKVRSGFGFRDIGSRNLVAGAHLFAGKDNADRAAYRPFRSVGEEIDSIDILMDEADTLQGIGGLDKILPAVVAGNSDFASQNQ